MPGCRLYRWLSYSAFDAKDWEWLVLPFPLWRGPNRWWFWEPVFFSEPTYIIHSTGVLGCQCLRKRSLLSARLLESIRPMSVCNSLSYFRTSLSKVFEARQRTAFSPALHGRSYQTCQGFKSEEDAAVRAYEDFWLPRHNPERWWDELRKYLTLQRKIDVLGQRRQPLPKGLHHKLHST
jgi:hypothetical protein